jgi:hypothetical protein
VTATDAGTAIVWGGDTTADDGTNTSELGELLTGWDGTPASAPMVMNAASETRPYRAFHGAALAGDGALIVWGGFRMTTATALNPVTQVVQRIATPLSSAVATTLANDTVATANGYGAAVAVGDGDVVMGGGNCGTDLACATGETWRYSVVSGAAAKTGALGVPRYGLALTLLADGTVLATGGLSATPAAIADLELYEPRGAADDPLMRAPGTVLMPCAVVEGATDGGGPD